MKELIFLIIKYAIARGTGADDKNYGPWVLRTPGASRDTIYFVVRNLYDPAAGKERVVPTDLEDTLMWFGYTSNTRERLLTLPPKANYNCNKYEYCSIVKRKDYRRGITMGRTRRFLSAFMLIVMITIIIPVNVNAAVLNGSAAKKNAVTVPKLGTTYTTRIIRSQKRKWYKFKTRDCNAGYRIVVKNVNISKEMWVNIYDSNGVNFDGEFLRKGDKYDVMYKLKRNQWYFIEITNAYSSAGTVSLYMSFRKDFIGDSKVSAKAINRKTTYNSSIEGQYDFDFFKFQPTAAGYYTFDFFNIGGSYKDIVIRDSYGKELDYEFWLKADRHFKSRNKLIKGRWYFIQISGACQGALTRSGYYSITVR